jgi:hypothetical protein
LALGAGFGLWSLMLLFERLFNGFFNKLLIEELTHGSWSGVHDDVPGVKDNDDKDDLADEERNVGVFTEGEADVYSLGFKET